MSAPALPKVMRVNLKNPAINNVIGRDFTDVIATFNVAVSSSGQ